MQPKVLTYEAVQIVGVARVVWDGEAAVTDGHLALTEGQREEAQLVQQTAKRLEETQQVSQQDRGQRTEEMAATKKSKHTHRHTHRNHWLRMRTRKPSLSHPFSLLTQISAFVVMILLLYRFTISGARYDKVVYLKYSRLAHLTGGRKQNSPF